MALPEETWLSDFTELGWREDLGLTLIRRNKGRARAVSPSSVQEEKPIMTIMSNGSHLSGPDPKPFVCVLAHNMYVLCHRCLGSRQYVSMIYCLISCDLGLCLLQFPCASVEADSVKERPVALLLKLLQELIDFILHVISVLDLKGWRTHVKQPVHTQTPSSFTHTIYKSIPPIYNIAQGDS